MGENKKEQMITVLILDAKELHSLVVRMADGEIVEIKPNIAFQGKIFIGDMRERESQ